MPSKMRHGLLIGLVVIGLFVLWFGHSHAETVNYIYDELNRLIRVEYEDGTALLYIYDKTGNRTEIAIPFPDTTPPTTTADPGGGAYNTLKTVTLNCNDGYGAGCDKIYYTTDGTTPDTSSPVYQSPIDISVTTTLRYFAKDLVGNSEAVKTQIYTIDATAPTTTASPGGGFYSTAQTVTLTCDDGAGSGCDKIYYTTDGNDPTPSSPVYSSPISISVSTTLKFFAKDLAGNSETIKTEAYYIGPESVSTPSNPNGPINGNVGTSYTYSTGGAASSYGHSVEYLFDWGDGTNSGWLSVAQTSASHSWSSQGNYFVKTQARCSIHQSVVSGWSGTTSVSIVSPPGNDSYTKSLLHMNGIDGSTVFTDDAAGGTHTWTAHGNTQIDTAQSKFGGTSGLYDGSGDYIDTPDSADWAMGSGNFTVDFWIKRGTTGSVQHIDGQCNSAGQNISIAWCFVLNANNTVSLWIFYGANYVIATSTIAITDTTTWHHIAGVRYGTGTANIKLFIDGTLAATANLGNNSVNDSPNKLAVGRLGEYTSDYFNGWIDEYRVSKGIARWTSNFTPPTNEY